MSALVGARPIRISARTIIRKQSACVSFAACVTRAKCNAASAIFLASNTTADDRAVG
jgi:hypothetical protein